jgi:hypothetical protein
MKMPLKRLLGTACAALLVAFAPASGELAIANDTPVVPNSVNMLDCNGHSPLYSAAAPSFSSNCADPMALYDGVPTRFQDNGQYIGHDTPAVKFISTDPGSGNSMSYLMRLAVDPEAAPTPSSPTVTDYAEVSQAQWFGLPLCDPKSYPQNPCTPDSDSNSGNIHDPNAAGSAFLELQFYPPDYQPFIDGISCDASHYCAALTINSVSCTFGFVVCNNNCLEPLNFAFLQQDGVPAGPPSPQLANAHTFTPNARTLMMNPGDVLRVTINDTSQGLSTGILDLSTGRSGSMVASAANGFMNTNITDCSGTPFSFRAEYNTAGQQNLVAWTSFQAGVMMAQSIGHFEACSSVTSAFPVNQSYPDGQSFSDPNVFQVCQGGFEGQGRSGEGPCNPTTGVCTNPTTAGGGACPTNNFLTGALCEFSDAVCMPAGTRAVTTDGVMQTVRWRVAGCLANTFQKGDLDFDGVSYTLGWPDGTTGHPTPFSYLGPFDGNLRTYPTVQFETDVAGSEIQCNVATGAGCTVPPVGAAFYPYWTIGNGGIPDQSGNGDNSGQSGSGSNSVQRMLCIWTFGTTIRSVTKQTFGANAQYGTPDVGRFAGTIISQPVPNPQISSGCLG